MRAMTTTDGPAGATLPEPGRYQTSLHERLIDVGIVAADGHGSIIDYLTAWRLSIWLAARHLLRR